MITIDKAIKTAKFICENLGKEVYIIDNLDCDECPDIEGADCPYSRISFKNHIKELACREKRVIVRRVELEYVGIRFSRIEGTIDVLIDDTYCCDPDEIFTTKEAATAYMERLPADILKFYAKEEP